eukprot:CAMPEP_0184872140 /NCGR_PEP_ID=MMETSP0580-20130426/41115_1 /TAXON_ID=1118495 /ORGANISM="Dactyliosolen fragilissimus" /LENGTH=764 /DNA_ID=CAMNT_0027374885 /DNA_START=177 /DNA_END=2471 /DNA_ORIENTATION=+
MTKEGLEAYWKQFQASDHYDLNLPRSDMKSGKEEPKSISTSKSMSKSNSSKDHKILTAYIEDTDQSQWSIKPLPMRNTTSSSLLELKYPKVNSCRNLPSQWPINESMKTHNHRTIPTMKRQTDLPTDADPFLPWIHDVFPTADGKYVQFIAQNRRRCQTGAKYADIKAHMQPNIALFQHVPIKRTSIDADGEQRYRLASHTDADEDGMETRFLCHFPSVRVTTLSKHNVNYDYHTYRKGYQSTFTEEGFDNHIIWTSQLLFQCPIPEQLVDIVKSGRSVVDDYATLYVDLVPVRTPPRYAHPMAYMPPRYAEKKNTWLDTEFYGTNHILPRIQDSGRWTNIPICKPSLMTYPDEGDKGGDDKFDNDEYDNQSMQEIKHEQDATQSKSQSQTESQTKHQIIPQQQLQTNFDSIMTTPKKHKLIACTWASVSFHTRGSRTVVSDGEKRLREWAEFHRLAGVDHIYLYDNSGQFHQDMNLQPVVDLFPGFITRIDWPCKICNNNPGQGDNKGERSSQYAAESSCRLRFGEHAQWLASMDTDEYLVPKGNHTNLTDVLKKAEEEKIHIFSFKSKRAKPRLDLLDRSKVTNCNGRTCLDPSIPENKTFLEIYNCDIEKPPRKNTMPAEKQIYRPDYVKFHFVHYSTITTLSKLNRTSTKELGYTWRHRYQEPHVRFADEETEMAMLHSKSIVISETKNFNKACKNERGSCSLGIPFEPGIENRSNPSEMAKTTIGNEVGWICNCFPHENISNYWIPLLNKALVERGSLK